MMSNLSLAFNAQGLKHLSSGAHSVAIDFFLAASTEDPSFPDPYTNLGVACFMMKKFTEAAQWLRRSLSLRPDDPAALLNLGYSLWSVNDMAGAIIAFQHAIEVTDVSAAHIAYGAAQWEIGNEAIAIDHCRRGLMQEPDNVMALDTLREIYHYRGSKDDAFAACDTMIELFPEQPNHVYKKAVVALTYGDASGWSAFERCRYPHLELTKLVERDPIWFRVTHGRLWDGRPTKHLLLTTEQGYGDVIQFLRFVPLAAQRCERLSLLVPETLRDLVRRSFQIPHMKIVPEFPDEFDHYVLVMSLPTVLGAYQTIPSTPYLIAPPVTRQFDGLDGIKIGLAWEGSKSLPDDRWRSIPFAKIRRLLDVPAHFILLQHPCADDLRGTSVITLPLRDWSTTASIIAALDLVITVDTAVAHMAGALGKPVWLLNRYNTCWRWGLGTNTHWYPSMRIFRQPKMADWDTVIEQVHAELYRVFSL
jgi:tetratricopeptide (TPR) repeat protein